MSKIDCGSCDNLRENAPEFAQNGVTDNVCTSLQNDTGFNPNLSTLHTDCEDLNDANDCLVGRLDDEVEAYDVCDWKPFMHKFLPNLYELLKAGICALCGVWKNIHDLIERVTKLECRADVMENSVTFYISEEPTEDSYIVAGEGVSFKERGSDINETDVYIQYISGGLGYMGGTLNFHENAFTDSDGKRRNGNPEWGKTGEPTYYSELIHEIRIKRSAFPRIAAFTNGFGQESYAGGFHVRVVTFYAGKYAAGQHGVCDINTGESTTPGVSSGHLVPSGWVYIQLRMTYIENLQTIGPDGIHGGAPVAFLGIIPKTSGIC